MSLHAVIVVKSNSVADHLNDQILSSFRSRLTSDLAGGVSGTVTTVEVTYPEPVNDEAEQDAADATLAEAYRVAWQAGYDEAQARQAEIDAEKASAQQAAPVVADIEDDDVLDVRSPR